ncbi:MAG TPA: uracil-DNA glycosylase [Verrucomicrobiae bacterium]|nr:uracil-DNA glycosylase [Verrucomicrobiae bacterium]
MSVAYDRLLEAAIQHLHELKQSGARFVPVHIETLARLTRPAPTSPTRPPIHRPARAQQPPTPPRSPIASREPAAARRALAAPVEELNASSADARAPSIPALGAEEKLAAFAAVRQRALACVKCANLAAARKNVVFGVGDINAQLMFVGEAPGADEDAQGEPFVGRAGQLLTRIIQTMGLSRESVYIANILKCRPDTPGWSAGNRKPTTEEMQTCIPFLHEQIDLIRPRVLVALGGTAVEGLLGKTAGITRLRGHWQSYRGIPLMPTYHPSFLLRNQALSEKRRVWEDMLQVMERLEMPISDKQRSFFAR